MIIPGIINCQQFPQFRTQTRLRLRAQELLLVLLLRFVRATKKRMHRSSLAIRPVRSSAMPCMRIADHDSTGLAGHQNLLRVHGKRIGHLLLWPLSPFVRTWHHSCRTVLRRKVIEHENSVRDPVTPLIGNCIHVHMQGLISLAHRIGRSHIQTGKFELRA